MEAKTEKNLLPPLTMLTQIPWSDLKVGDLQVKAAMAQCIMVTGKILRWLSSSCI